MRFMIAAAAAAFLVACSPGGAARQRIVDQCLGEGPGMYTEEQQRTMCTCFGDRLAAGLTPAQLEIVAKGDTATAEEQAALAGDPGAMQTMMGALTQCAAGLGQ